MPHRSSHAASHHQQEQRLAAVPTDEPHDDDDDDDDEILMDPLHDATGGTVVAAVFGIIKAMVGPAILYLPRSFADAGYAFALTALVGTTVLYLYASQRLLQSWRHVVVARQTGEGHPDDTMAYDKKHSNLSTHDSTTAGVTPDDEHETDEIEMVSVHDGNDDKLNNQTQQQQRQLSAMETVDDDDDNEEEQNHDDCQMHVIPLDEETDGLHRCHGVTYPQLAHLAYGTTGETAVRTGICLMQLGICLTYFIFVPHNFTAGVTALTAGRIVPSPTAGLLGMMVLEAPLCWIRDIRRLVHTNVLANVLISFGLVSSLYLALVVAPRQSSSNVNPVGNGTTTTTTVESPSLTHLSPWNDHWYLFIGTSVLLFEGSITLCLPLQQALDGPDAADKFPVIYKQTITGIVLFYSCFGMICWTAFGDSVNTVLTVSLPKGVLATLVQLLYSIAVIFTFPLQIFPASEIVVHLTEKLLYRYRLYTNVTTQNTTFATQQQQHHAPPLLGWQRRVLVVAVLIVLAAVAVVEMNNLGRVVSLMGSLLGCPLAFVFPPLIHNHVVPGAPLALNYAVAGLGSLAMVVATWITLATWGDDNGPG